MMSILCPFRQMAALKAKARKKIDAGVTGEDLRRAKIAADQQMAQWRERMAARKAKMQIEKDVEAVRQIDQWLKERSQHQEHTDSKRKRGGYYG